MASRGRSSERKGASQGPACPPGKVSPPWGRIWGREKTEPEKRKKRGSVPCLADVPILLANQGRLSWLLPGPFPHYFDQISVLFDQFYFLIFLSPPFQRRGSWRRHFYHLQACPTLREIRIPTAGVVTLAAAIVVQTAPIVDVEAAALYWLFLPPPSQTLLLLLLFWALLLLLFPGLLFRRFWWRNVLL